MKVDRTQHSNTSHHLRFVHAQRRYTRVNSQGGSLYGGPGPEYDDPANCAPEEDQYGSQYGAPYGGPYDHYGSRGSVGRRSVGECCWDSIVKTASA